MPQKLKFLVVSLILFLSAGCAVNPITGEEELMLMGEEQDVAIGKKYAPELEKQMGGKIKNAALQNYVSSVGQKVASVSHRRSWNYQFAALEDDMVNAFALPGGYIFITKGMLIELTTESQLASILAHETAHVVARDTAALMSREIGISILLSAAVSNSSSSTARTAADLTRQIIGLRFSRRDEKDADLAGLDYMVRAGYDPNGMVETMQILQSQQKERPIEFFSTHPNPENRIGYLKSRINVRYRKRDGLRIGKEDFHSAVLVHIKKD
ncbi:MAG: M48 family metalloprotease [Phycisphaerae bacterium]|nr:M48 family metalloprotease [Phycisphaerae bacterium]NIP53949.1 M48 family metalloprotease [Phycisphaerae bacterium]NIS52873.1 M48 family metalloprotease [Phycisphaerae bacterium]NIU10337.1 M48 family metalloprotease [Phycisphaerae bacterium]NIU58040.1 M48 family metalloprotease [Phycisphaerae bacterium]